MTVTDPTLVVPLFADFGHERQHHTQSGFLALVLRVEADVVKFPLLSLFNREENREGDTATSTHYTTTDLR